MTDTNPRLELTLVDDALVVVGEVDAHTAPMLGSRIEERNAAQRRLDLSGVDFMDFTGLRVLIDAHNHAEAAGDQLVIVSPSRPVARLIELGGLLDHLHIEGAAV